MLSNFPARTSFRRIGVFWAIILLTLLVAPPVPAQTPFQPVRDVSELRAPGRTETVRVSTAKVVLADYDLLRRDFPLLSGMSEDEIDSWLITFSARISKTQVTQNRVNTPIQHQSEHMPMAAYRPQTYGRALVFEVPGGLIDAKGAGAIFPVQRHHGNGLASLGEAIREYLYQKAVQRIFDHAQADVATVGVYGVLDYGFDIVFNDGTSPAGLILRQAHTRSPLPESRLSGQRALGIENVLRPYGFTSTGLRFSTQNVHVTNIQGTADERAIVDFGTFLVLNEEFSHPIKILGSPDIIGTDDRDFIRMDPNLRITPDVWGSPGVIDPTLDYPWLWSHELAQNWRAGIASREHFEQHVRNMMAPIELVTSTQKRVISSPRAQCKSNLKPASP